MVDEVEAKQNIGIKQLQYLLDGNEADYLKERAVAVRKQYYGTDVYIRGLIEFTNYCRNNCYYCGIRRGNSQVDRYRLSSKDILDCCAEGYRLGFRTFVLQGGEDLFFTDEKICQLIKSIKKGFPDCAVTLSIGEKSRDSYEKYFAAGADRYLLRHETANYEHYRQLHPPDLSLDNRKRCLKALKGIGYQVGAGFMVGSPGQTKETIYEDLQFLRELNPHMVGIGPFIPQGDTPFGKEQAGTVDMTVTLLAIIRLLLPRVLLPATTALGTIDTMGREKGLMSGANVVMPNLSPKRVRAKYALYDKKICTGEEAAECIECLKNRVGNIGYRIVCSRGDYIDR
ncbi:[FeFe] hydrogenase H-cluster radical SAM maturase HydE [Anaerovibrio sp.]|uniref:[FeFe] hydrogenase H-cluster radical SAM maturase HydE n=1 Tax=Anaerovibrio sp. TaxID=1872532 RepID=UPI0025C6A01B|nr:[FeFe] hydrogenase H-cluster radical SAM maturase HydE [Anaerovibrio sp.]